MGGSRYRVVINYKKYVILNKVRNHLVLTNGIFRQNCSE